MTGLCARADNGPIVDGDQGTRRRCVRVRHVFGRCPVEREEGRAEGVAAETAVRRHAGRSHAAGQTDGPGTRGRIRVPDVQDGRTPRHVVHHGPLDQLRDRYVRAHGQVAEPLGYERRRLTVPAVPVTS